MPFEFEAFPPGIRFPLLAGSTPPPLQPATLAPGATTDFVPFTVPDAGTDMFIRVIALFRDNQPLRGKAPGFELRAGEGGPTPLTVTPEGSPSAVPVVGTVGVSPKEAAFASCERENNDVYFIHMARVQPRRSPWLLRITNTESQILHFVWFSSATEAQTRRPWMVWGAQTNNFDDVGDLQYLTFELSGTITESVPVRNLGSGTLTLTDPPSQPIGPAGSPLLLISRPDSIPPHHVDTVAFGVDPQDADADAEVDVRHVVASNDDVHVPSLLVRVISAHPPPVLGPHCNIDHCDGYRDHTSGTCSQPGCGHDLNHHGLGAPCRTDRCMGFLTDEGRMSGDGSCVQPGCGHTEDRHGPPPVVENGNPCGMCGCPDFVGKPSSQVGHPGFGHPTLDPSCTRAGCGHAWLAHNM